MTDHTSRIAEAKRLERSSSDRMLAGVAGGLARYFDIHPAFFRVGFVVLALLGGSGILIYAAAALVMPGEGEADSVATRALRQRRDRPWPLIGLGLLAVAGAVAVSNMSFWPHGDVWIVLAIAGGVIFWVTRHGLPEPRSEDEAAEAATLARRDSHRVRRFFKGHRDRRRVARRARARRGRGHRGGVPRPRRGRHRRPRLRRRRRRAISTAPTSSGSARCGSTSRRSRCLAGETHVAARIDIGDL